MRYGEAGSEQARGGYIHVIVVGDFCFFSLFRLMCVSFLPLPSPQLVVVENVVVIIMSHTTHSHTLFAWHAMACFLEHGMAWNSAGTAQHTFQQETYLQ